MDVMENVKINPELMSKKCLFCCKQNYMKPICERKSEEVKSTKKDSIVTKLETKQFVKIQLQSEAKEPK